MRPWSPILAVMLGCSVAIPALAADDAGSHAKAAVDEAKEAARQAKENVKAKAGRAANKAKAKAGEAADKAKEAGKAAAAKTKETIERSSQQNAKGGAMKGFVQDIEGLAIKNDDFRQVLYTAKHCQLVVMALKPNEEIGAEVHKLDQFFRVEEGSGEAVLDGVRTSIRAGFAVLVPAGTNHNIINTGTVPLKLYTVYSPPNHRDGVVHHTRRDADADKEHFDGKTTE
jgi:mannose-6-phosphate isomerase-like protein (cupin superfamily)